LGPFFFIIFINDLSYCIKNSEFLFFADDLKIFKSVNSISDSELFQNDLVKVGNWCSRNKFPLNLSMCFHVRYGKQLINVLSSNSISSHIISLRNEYLDLGVMFDTKFTFVDHINYIIPKAYAMYGFVKRNSTQFKDP